MKEDFTTTISVNATSHDAFKAINKVTKWWTENLDGSSEAVGDEFTVRFGEIHVSTQKLIEVVPDKRVVWLVTESRLNFIRKMDEWTGHQISFDVFEEDGKTTVRFTQSGLDPKLECFDACSNAWSEYIHESLLSLIDTGVGHPTPKG